MTTPLVFTFPETAQHVRSVMIDGEPWFVGRDVAGVLGYSNPSRDVARHTTERQRGVYRIGTPSGDQEMVVISEPGIYRLVMRSNLEAAIQFQDWLSEEVLPSLRRTGSYSAAPREMTKLEALQAAIESEQGRLAAEARVRELEPAANSWQVLASGEGDFAVADAAKILGRDPSITLGRNRLFALLAEYRWTYRQPADDKPRALQTAVERGWLSELPQSYEHPRTGDLVLTAPQVRITAKGLHELHKRLGGTAAVAIPTVPTHGGAA